MHNEPGSSVELTSLETTSTKKRRKQYQRHGGPNYLGGSRNYCSRGLGDTSDVQNNMDPSKEALSEGSRSDSELRHSILHPSSRAVKIRLQMNKSFFLDLFYQSSLLVIL